MSLYRADETGEDVSGKCTSRRRGGKGEMVYIVYERQAEHTSLFAEAACGLLRNLNQKGAKRDREDFSRNETRVSLNSRRERPEKKTLTVGRVPLHVNRLTIDPGQHPS